MRGRETPNQRQSKASKVVKGMAADEPAPHRNRLSTKNTPNAIPGTKKEVINTLVFQRRPPTTVQVCVCVCVCVQSNMCAHAYMCTLCVCVCVYLSSPGNQSLHRQTAGYETSSDDHRVA